MRPKKKYRRGAIAHVYQRADKGFILFYSIQDCLFFLTVFYTVALKHNLTIVGLCLMPDHLHFLVEASSQKEISSFVDEYSSMYARAFNSNIGRTGHVFRISYGLANKTTDKAKRSAILYVLNNPVEKKLSQVAEKWRWNLLLYEETGNPFSQKVILSKAFPRLRCALKSVKMKLDEGKPVPLVMLERISKGLNEVETEQLVDYVVSCYNPIDYAVMKDLFGSFESVIAAARTTTGSEYDIKEEFNSHSDKAYSRIRDYLKAKGSVKNARDVIMLPVEVKLQLMNEILSMGIATGLQVAKYFHVENTTQDC